MINLNIFIIHLVQHSKQSPPLFQVNRLAPELFFFNFSTSCI